MQTSVKKILPAGIVILSLLFTACHRKEQTTPQRKDLVDAVFASGNITMSNSYLVISQTEGYLQKKLVSEGDSVQPNQLLFQLLNETPQSQLESAEAAYQKAQGNLRETSPVLQKLHQQEIQLSNQLRTDSANFARYQNLVGSNAVSRVDYDRARLAYENSQAEFWALQNTITETRRNLKLDLANAKANLVSQQENNGNFCIVSREKGVVLRCLKESGELVKRGETIAEIGAGEFIARLQVAEEDINRIALGQEAFVELNTSKNHAFRAKISKIYPAFDTQDQSFIVEARFAEPVAGLKAGTQLQTNIVVGERKHALVIPAKYLLSNDFILTESGEKKQVTTGIKNTDWVEITGGLTESETIVLPGKK